MFSFYVDVCDCNNKKMIPWDLEGLYFDLFDHDIQNTSKYADWGPVQPCTQKNKNDNILVSEPSRIPLRCFILLCLINLGEN